jgi:1-acyl-sn-glycerol-3-phosphate acyltransferase
MDITHRFVGRPWLRNLFFKLAGWRIDFEGYPAPRGVIIVYPHTSNWDFLVGIFTKWSLGIPLNFWAKEGLFTGAAKYTLGPLMGYWGAIKVERSASNGAVAQTITAMNAKPVAWLALAPEGTRSLAPGIKSGFYRVATQMQVPLGIAYFDYGKKLVKLREFVMLSGDEQSDLAMIEAYYKAEGVRGHKPELESPFRFVNDAKPAKQFEDAVERL